MGFSCGIYKVEKRGKCNTVEDYNHITNYLAWKNNPWNFEDNHYPTFEKYWKGTHSMTDEPYPGIPDKKTAALYQSEKNEYGIRDYGCEELFSVCSIGRELDGFMTSTLQKVNELDFVGFNAKTLKEIIKWTEEDEIAGHTPVTVDSGIVFDADGNKKIIHLDGVIVKNADGWNKTIMREPDDRDEYDIEYSDDALFIGQNPDDFIDEIKNVKKALHDVAVDLLDTDFDKYLVWYSRSY